VRLHFEDGEREVLVTRLGLGDDADDTAIAQAVANWMQEDPAAGGNNDNENDGGGGSSEDGGTIDASQGDVVIVDVASYARLQARDRLASEVEETTRRRDRDELIEEAIADGKFSPSRRDHYKARYDSDLEGTVALIGRLTPNTVPLEARGADTPTDEVDDSAYPTNWVPEVAARSERPKGRVHGES
jgi:Mu-like prophage I protein